MAEVSLVNLPSNGCHRFLLQNFNNRPEDWCQVNIGSGNGLVSSGIKPFHESMLTHSYVVIWQLKHSYARYFMMIQLLNYHIIARKCKKDVVQERRNSIDNAPELRFSCTNPSILLLHPLLVFARFLQNLTWECVELSETEARKLCTHHLAEDHIVALCTEKIGRRFSEYTALHMDACMDDILVMKHDNEIDWQLGRQHRDQKSTHVMVNKMSVSALPRSEGGDLEGSYPIV